MNAQELLDDLLEVLCDGDMVDEPAGRGCGYAIHDNGIEQMLEMIEMCLGKDSNMKNKVFDCEVVLEVTDENGKISNKTVVGRMEVFAASPEAARVFMERRYGNEILQAESEGEAEVLVRPFCG